MNRAEFEQLVSAWLDEPRRDDLRGRVEAAARADAELARELDRWQRLMPLLREGLPAPLAVDWAALKARIATAIDRYGADGHADAEALDVALRRLPPVDDRVDWARLRGRIGAALTRAGGPVSARRKRSRWVVSGAGLVAAAAAIVLALLPAGQTSSRSVGSASIAISPPPADQLSRGIALARIADVAREQPERFFNVDPIVRTGPSEETAGYY
jgi:hypothetical protein